MEDSLTTTLVFRCQPADSHRLQQFNAALRALSIDNARQFGDAEDLYELSPESYRLEVVRSLLRDRGFELVNLSMSDIHTARITYVADKLDLLCAALNGEYHSKDEPGYTISDVTQALIDAIRLACYRVPTAVLVPALQAAAKALRNSVQR